MSMVFITIFERGGFMNKRESLENILRSVTLSGTIEQYIKILDDESPFEFKMVCADGREYSVAMGSSVKNLSSYVDKRIKVFGLLNKSNNKLIVQKIVLQNSNEEENKTIELDYHRRRKLINKIARTVNELVIIPIAILAVLVAS